MSAHTPGPWRIESPPDNSGLFDIIGGTEWTIAEAIERPADARLIVAAPDMLAALGPMRIALQKQVDLLRFRARNSTAGVARVQVETAEEWQALCDNAEAALAKATVTGVAS